MKKALILIFALLGLSGYSQNILSNNWQTRFNGFQAAFVVGSGTPASGDTIAVWRTNKDWRHFGKAFLAKDSIPILSAIGAGYLLVMDTTAGAAQGQLKRILPSSLGLGGTTIYTGDGSISSNRTITGASLATLTFDNFPYFKLKSSSLQFTNSAGLLEHTFFQDPTGRFLQMGVTHGGVFDEGPTLTLDTNANVVVGSGNTPNIVYSTKSLVTVFGANLIGGKAEALSTYTTDAAITIAQMNVYIDASGGNVTITLPLASVSVAGGGAVGWKCVFKRKDSSVNVVTVQVAGASGDLIDGLGFFTLTALGSKTIQAVDTGNFYIIGN